jgi:uncharacterized protein YjbI with pentapeptide repeats
VPLKEFDWQNTNLFRAWWPRINASEVDFWRADLSFVGMRNAVLRKATLVEVRLDGSVLAGTDLTGAALDRASLRGTDLRDTILEGATFQGAIYDDKTRFPEHFDPIARGLIKDGVATLTEV